MLPPMTDSAKKLLGPLLALVCLLLGPATALGADAPVKTIPIGRADASWGHTDAPVTMVVFLDMQCPYCGRMLPTIDELKRDYGASKLRVVLKHHPLAFHSKAQPAAEAAVAVHQLYGDAKLWRFMYLAFDVLKTGDHRDALQQLGVDVDAVQQLMDSGAPRRKVQADAALAAKLGANGTPASFINGSHLRGAQPKDAFARAIDDELAKAKKLRARGVLSTRISQRLTEDNLLADTPAAKPAAARAPKPAAIPAAAAPSVDTTVWQVPVGTSPVLGNANALVTMVVFSDFQCPFCSRVNPTLKALKSKYGDDLRIVFKHQPLSFHQRAEPAAQFASEAFKQQGHVGFWRAHDALFAQQRQLEDTDLAQLAGDLGLNVAQVMRAIADHHHQQAIGADMGLAQDVGASGTPTMFVNGRKMVGAQPVENFVPIIDAELASARQLVGSGIRRDVLYAHIIKDGQLKPVADKKMVAAPNSSNPSKGPPNAKVVIQVFSDFQCPFCRRSAATVSEIEKAYAGKVRIVFRHRPLDFHNAAMPAHIASAEAFAQRGHQGFWRMHDLLFSSAQLDRETLLGYARTMGLNMGRFTKALDEGHHKPAIASDVKVADDADIHGTPSFVIGEYFVSGAQPLSKFKRVIDASLAGR